MNNNIQLPPDPRWQETIAAIILGPVLSVQFETSLKAA